MTSRKNPSDSTMKGIARIRWAGFTKVFKMPSTSEATAKPILGAAGCCTKGSKAGGQETSGSGGGGCWGGSLPGLILLMLALPRKNP